MNPGLSIQNFRHHRLTYTEHARKRSMAEVTQISEIPHSSDLRFGEFVVALLPASKRLSTFIEFVLSVISSRPNEEVVRPAAWSIIAFVKNHLAGWYWTVFKFPSNPMGSTIRLSGNAPIPTAKEAQLPDPTFPSFVHPGPEIFLVHAEL